MRRLVKFHQILLVVLDRLVKWFQNVKRVKEPLHCVLRNLYLLFLFHFVVHDEYQQQAWQVLVKSFKHHSWAFRNDSGLDLGIVLYFKNKQQAFDHRVELGLHFLIFNLFANDGPEPAMLGEELNKLEIKLIIKVKWQEEDSPGIKGFLFNLAGIIIKHFFLDGFDAHFEVIFHGIFVHQLLREVEYGLADWRVEDEELAALGELLEEVGVGLLVVEGLEVGLVLAGVGCALHVVVEALGWL